MEEDDKGIENVAGGGSVKSISGGKSVKSTSNRSQSPEINQQSLSAKSEDEGGSRDYIYTKKSPPETPPFMCKTPFMLETDVIKANRKTLPNIEEEIIKAKQFLKRQGTSGDSLYDHLAEVIQKVLLYQPDNIVDYIEIFSSDLKEDRFQSHFDRLRNEYILTKNMDETMQIYKLYKDLKTKREDEINDETMKVEVNEEQIIEEDTLKIPNLIESNFYFKQAGLGLPDWEIYNLSISLNRFVSTKPVIVTKVRFFGKIFGTLKNYYVLETELTMEEIENRLNPKIPSVVELPPPEESKRESEVNVENPEPTIEPSVRSEMDLYGGEEEGEEEEMEEPPREPSLAPLPDLPENKWQPPREVPSEKLGEGLNVKVYWVCNNLGEDWVSLPEVQPKYIDTARKISLCMTGNLDKQLHTYPPFDGTEKDYLRAQIARIAGSTMVSPAEYFVPGTEGEDEEEEVDAEDGNVTQIKKNKHYEGHPLRDLVDKSMSFWVHNSTFVLKQGRAKWWNPNSKEIKGEGDEEDEEEEEEGEGEDDGGELREEGLPLLVALSEEQQGGEGAEGAEGAEEVPCWWRVRPASQLQPPSGPTLATLRSLRWPGAVAYATVDGKFDNVYIGWGLKYLPEGYCPPHLPPVCSEYPLGPEIMEMLDPTVDEEEEFRIAHLPPIPPLEIQGEGEEMEGEAE